MDNHTEKKAASSFNLVVGLKFSDEGSYAFEQATRIAERIPGCALHLLHIGEEAASATKTRELIGHLRVYANEKARSLGALPLSSIGIHVRGGEPAEAIARFAAEVHADLIVVGSSKMHLKNFYTAPTVEKLIAAAACPVVVAGPKQRSHAPSIVIEPVCPDCLAARASSKGAKFWCARHSEHAKRAHTFSYQRELPLRTHDSEVIPTGVDME